MELDCQRRGSSSGRPAAWSSHLDEEEPKRLESGDSKDVAAPSGGGSAKLGGGGGDPLPVTRRRQRRRQQQQDSTIVSGDMRSATSDTPVAGYSDFNLNPELEQTKAECEEYTRNLSKINLSSTNKLSTEIQAEATTQNTTTGQLLFSDQNSRRRKRNRSRRLGDSLSVELEAEGRKKVEVIESPHPLTSDLSSQSSVGIINQESPQVWAGSSKTGSNYLSSGGTRRERSASITSDYYSSSQNSPLYQIKQRDRLKRQPEIANNNNYNIKDFEIRNKENNHQQQSTISNKTITIYENPLFRRQNNNNDKSLFGSASSAGSWMLQSATMRGSTESRHSQSFATNSEAAQANQSITTNNRQLMASGGCTTADEQKQRQKNQIKTKHKAAITNKCDPCLSGKQRESSSNYRSSCVSHEEEEKAEEEASSLMDAAISERINEQQSSSPRSVDIENHDDDNNQRIGPTSSSSNLSTGDSSSCSSPDKRPTNSNEFRRRRRQSADRLLLQRRATNDDLANELASVNLSPKSQLETTTNADVRDHKSRREPRGERDSTNATSSSRLANDEYDDYYYYRAPGEQVEASGWRQPQQPAATRTQQKQPSNYLRQQMDPLNSTSQSHYYQPTGGALISSDGMSQRNTEEDSTPTSESQLNNRMQQQQQQQQSIALPNDNVIYGSQLSPASDYHYYQVVVPPQAVAATDHSSSFQVPDWRRQQEHPRGNNSMSPCKSIQRIVSHLFAGNGTSNQSNGLDYIPTINQNLAPANNEPLIRSSSWQNKTLINFNKQHQVAQPPVHYLESSLIHQKTLPPQQQQNFVPMSFNSNNNDLHNRYSQFSAARYQPAASFEMSNLTVVQPQDQIYANGQDHYQVGSHQVDHNHHLYYGVDTLRNQRPPHDRLLSSYQVPFGANTQKGSASLIANAFRSPVGDQQNDYHQHSMSNGKAPPLIRGSLSSDSALGATNLTTSTTSNSQLNGGSKQQTMTGSGNGLGIGGSNPLAKSFKSPNELAPISSCLFCLCQSIGSTAKLVMLILLLVFGVCLSLLALTSTNSLIITGPMNNFGHQQQPPITQLDNQLNQLNQQQQYNYRAMDFNQSPIELRTAPPGERPPLQPQEPLELPPPTITVPIQVTPNPPPELQYVLSTPSYWLGQPEEAVASTGSDQSTCSAKSNGDWCSSRGLCRGGLCSCAPGFSGPTCDSANCPNECSRRGECKLRFNSPLNSRLMDQENDGDDFRREQDQQSVGFATLTAAMYRNSVCPTRRLPPEVASANLTGEQPSGHHDNRLEWHCVCEPGFSGPDCSIKRELDCSNKEDDDLDGLIDCEDDDCCSQPVCFGHMCYKSPEPSEALRSLAKQRPTGSGTPPPLPLLPVDGQTAAGNNVTIGSLLQAADSQGAFFAQFRFMIGLDSVQSYAQERAFDRRRAALVRGRVVKAPPTLTGSGSGNEELLWQSDMGIISVRVSVEESVQFGFTMTRADGSFDLLVNGSEWITLQFHRNAYSPVTRKIYARANAINLLNVEMQLSSATSAAASAGQVGVSDTPTAQFGRMRRGDDAIDSPPFNLGPLIDLHKFVYQSLKREEDRRRSQLFDCLANSMFNFLLIGDDQSQEVANEEPVILLQESDPTASSSQHLKTFILTNEAAFKTSIGAEYPSTGSGLKQQVIYNSADFSPSSSILKPTISIQLLPKGGSSYPKLSAVIVQLQIEGQLKRERLSPMAKLTYQFAWNRRNVYQQKVYGFGELTIKVGYEYEITSLPLANGSSSSSKLWLDCLSLMTDQSNDQQQQQQLKQAAGLSGQLGNLAASGAKRTVWFERRVFIEAHPMNHHADFGKWTLDPASNRYDREHDLLYFASGWSLPFKLVYPPLVSEPIPLQLPANKQISSQLDGEEEADENSGDSGEDQVVASRIMTRGPNNSMFVVIGTQLNSASRLVQLDSTGRRRLLDVPLNVVASKLGLPSTSSGSDTSSSTGATATHLPASDLQILYNNFLSTLYLSSRLAGRIIQISYSSLRALNSTRSSATVSAEDEIVIGPLCGFGRQYLSATSASKSPSDLVKLTRLVRLQSPHSMTLDEQRQLLYFVDGPSSLVALDLAAHRAILLQPNQRLPLRISGIKSQECGDTFLQKPYKLRGVHSLTWSKADSSLYLVDQNMVLALRQDSRLELVALGAAQMGDSPLRNCLLESDHLGYIKTLAADEQNGDLLIAHQWPRQSSVQSTAERKRKGHVYLAKLPLGLATRSRNEPPEMGVSRRRLPIDLHSAEAAYDPMIWRLAEGEFKLKLANETQQQPSPRHKIDWNNVAQLPPSLNKHHSYPQVQFQRSQAPFIHLAARTGFRRLDSIEFNSDGSIFLLDGSTLSQSLRLITSYSPLTYNSLERRNLNISRLFEAPSAADSMYTERSSYVTNFRGNSIDEDLSERRKLNVIQIQNPISNELMEFHSTSGLQLSVTHINLDKPADEWLRSEFYYKILTLGGGGSSSHVNGQPPEMDEDDRYDIQTQRTILNYLAIGQSTSGDDKSSSGRQLLKRSSGAIVRLDKVLDSSGDTYDFVRTYDESGQINLKSVLLNSQPICELNCDSGGRMIYFRQRDAADTSSWLELAYDPFTHLLSDIKLKLNKKIFYDKVFYHYCDLLIVKP